MTTQTTKATGSGRPESKKPDTHLMAVANRCVAANAIPGSNAYSGLLAALRTGITPAGEMQAMRQAGPFVTDLKPWQRSGALRAAATRAINKDVAHTTSMSLGRSLALLSNKDGGTSIETQIAALPLMRRDAAALVLDGLIGRCARHGIAVNFYDLARTLIYWGDGSGNRSTDRRNKIVLDFYLGSAQDEDDG